PKPGTLAASRFVRMVPLYVIPEGAGTVKSSDQGLRCGQDLVDLALPSGGRRDAARRRGHGGAPAAQRGRTTLRPSRAGRRMGGEGDGIAGSGLLWLGVEG